MSDLINRIANERLGQQPQTQPAPQGIQTQMPPQPPAPPTVPGPQPQSRQVEAKTATEQATAATAPKDEAARQAEDAIAYEIEFGPNDRRKLTPQQIKASMERYAALNHTHATMKPVLAVAEAILQRTNASPQQLAEYMLNLARANESNPTMGGQRGDDRRPQANRTSNEGQPTQADREDGDPLAKWEQENAASLPPGYREMLMGNQQTQRMLMETHQMLQRVLAQGQGVADAARVANQGAQNTRLQAARQTIANNLDRAQQVLQLPDNAAQDFMMFAGERGYTLEDFVDPQMTLRVMQDFRATMQSPEMERLREIAQRRQAFTGALGSTPTSGAVPASPEGQEDSAFNRLLTNAMASRGLG